MNATEHVIPACAGRLLRISEAGQPDGILGCSYEWSGNDATI